MASENNILNIPRPGAAATTRGLAVKLNGSAKYAVCGAGEKAIGIATNTTTAADQAVDACVLGTARATSGAAFSEGVKLASNAAGKLVKAITGDAVVAVALQDASGADVTVEVMVGAGSSGMNAESDVIVATVGVEGAVAANAIEVACAITNADGTAITAAREVAVRSTPTTADKGDIAAAGTPVGTLHAVQNPATGDNTAHFTTTAGGLFSFRVTNDQVENNGVIILGEGCEAKVLKLVFA